MLTVTDLFAGAGGSSQGAITVPGVRVALAMNHWALAVQTHNTNHPDTDHDCADISQVDPRRYPTTDILWASPECFTAGHLVTTTRGQVAIELVEVGDTVLTHRNRWREVVRVQAREASDLVTVSGQGHPGIVTTATHRFWARPSDRKWQNDIRQYRREYQKPDWIEASLLAETRALWATPTIPDMLPVDDLPPVFAKSDNGWWLLGRWLGDGSLSFGRNHEVTITCGFHEADELAPLLASTGVRWHRSDKRTAAVFTASCVESRDWLLKTCGHGAAHKQAPAWTTSLGELGRRGILYGYMSADGGTTQRRHRASTVSRALAVSIRLLAESLGHRVSVAYDKRTAYSIEGRSGVAKRQWILHWEPVLNATRSPEAFEANNHAWSRVRKVTPLPGLQTVYNIEVAEDHSYVLDGIVVKNCTNHSVARGKKRQDATPDLFGDQLPDAAADRSRATMWDVPRFAEYHRYRTVIVENVVDAADWLPFHAWLLAMGSLGYDHQVVYLNSMHAQRHGLPAPQSRDRMYVVFWRKGDRRPDIEAHTRPEAFCEHHGVISAVQSWKRDKAWGRYRAQYVWRCPRTECRNAIVEPGWLPASAAIDWTLEGKRIGDRAKPLAPKTMARIKAGLERYGSVPYLTIHRGDRVVGQADNRTQLISDGLPTLTASGNFIGLTVPVEGRDGKDARPLGEPMRTMTTRNETGIVITLRGQNAPKSTTDPLDTFAANGNHHGLLMRNNSSRGDGAEMVTPTSEVMRTLTTHGHQSLLVPYRSGSNATPSTQPLPTLTTVDPAAHVISAAYIEDCLFRMLEPTEIARGMAFPTDYVMLGNRREQVRLAGNAVTPPAARDLVAAVAEALGGAS